MNMFDEIREKVSINLSDWVKINDPKSKWTIEDFPYDTGVDENLIRPHCWRCVTVNQCWFVDKEGKRPQEFDYSKYSFADIPLVKRGLYHPNCHDQKIKISTPKEKDITLVLPQGKIDYLFREKAHIYDAMGYHSNKEMMYAYELTKKIIKDQFCKFTIFNKES